MKTSTFVRKAKMLTSFIACIVLVASCGYDQKTDGTKDVAEERNEEKFDDNKQRQDAQFLVNAAEINLEEIQLGQLAQQKGRTTHVKELGKAMEDAHTKSQRDLTALAQRKNISIPSSPTENAKDAYDVLVKESLRFLMTREVAHFQMFQAALESIKPNFPPGILQSDPRYSNKYFNMSKGEDFRGGWNEGKSPEMGEEWQYVENPLEHVEQTNGLLNDKSKGTQRTEKSVQQANKALSAERKATVDEATLPENGVMSWSVYEEGEEAKSIMSKINN